MIGRRGGRACRVHAASVGERGTRDGESAIKYSTDAELQSARNSSWWRSPSGDRQEETKIRPVVPPAPTNWLLEEISSPFHLPPPSCPSVHLAPSLPPPTRPTPPPILSAPHLARSLFSLSKWNIKTRAERKLTRTPVGGFDYRDCREPHEFVNINLAKPTTLPFPLWRGSTSFHRNFIFSFSNFIFI